MRACTWRRRSTPPTPRPNSTINTFIGEVYPQVEAAEQQLKQKLLDSRLEPPGFEIPLRNMRAEAALFREDNLPLLVENRKLGSQYNKIIGAQTVPWEGQELTLQQMRPIAQNPDRAVRERAWRLAANRWLADRAAHQRSMGEDGSAAQTDRAQCRLHGLSANIAGANCCALITRPPIAKRSTLRSRKSSCRPPLAFMRGRNNGWV